MSEITLFENDEFRLEIQSDGANGFRVLAPPVARQLGYRDAARMLETVPAAEKGYTTASTPGGEQRVSFLTEGGFYRVFGQRQAARVTDRETRAYVERFQSWVFNDVLPKLRRGELVQAKPAVNPAEISRRELAQMILAAEDRADAEAARAEIAEQRNAELEPKAAAADALMESEGTVSMGAVANAFEIGRTELFKMLRAEKIIQGDRRPYQEYAGWFRVAIKHYDDSNGVQRPFVNTRMYPAGALRLHALLTKRGRELRKPVFDNQLSLLSGGAA